MRTLLCALAAASAVLTARAAPAAENLTLAPGLSFVDDSSDRFPIQGERLDDAEVGGGRPAIVFFGAAHCWNTNREAERLVALYPRFRDRVRFVIVDVNHPSDAQRPLLAAHYHGTIPTLVVFGAGGGVLYARAGETATARGDTAALQALLRHAAGD
jgi:hypothetical protein